MGGGEGEGGGGGAVGAATQPAPRPPLNHWRAAGVNTSLKAGGGNQPGGAAPHDGAALCVCVWVGGGGSPRRIWGGVGE